MARRYDPDRRQRIIDAAITVVGERGIAGLSHRSVAAAADVPLGSTTYHFATLDELLVAALRQSNVVCLDDFARWVDGIDPAAPLAEEVARLVEDTLTGDRRRMELEYELYLAALRHEAVRPIAAECLDEMVRLLGQRIGDLRTARTVVALTDGLVLQHLLTGQPFDPEAVRAGLAGVLA
ncbi:TetR family transcriptional regulator C-terminal domain-containing protein [Streptomyces sp. Je 1-4]|uniref:TetR/AcrR family transcriptional regulator n=1 Tax=Streptomyces TaxID=1883 RepID=UPI0021DB09F2|nr:MULTISPECIES: TetR family transcriptional regulator C-terminal domain-containing protein [unclassified Streptomyces]UYB43079.1 TetR family transcriptional regulator C-terminal domain-containing protein [Streptomyces sp. Je 1-4]UZQ39432.1 TetR family transcriptional regulator C-terminal domain-containing protein [Streptomyces sp. Je 1-4] [Streptomyces sp. Je 1-4 4N24]UZQ46849.1 TetR family transcriptional regulator C-terminal domain-containing protein [Streptomyces sp. Je 1-4] [Streptomyces sp